MTDTTRTGYLRMPTIHGDWIVFTAEDDLWRVRILPGPSIPPHHLPPPARATLPATDSPLPAGRGTGGSPTGGLGSPTGGLGEDPSPRAERLTAGVAEATDARVSPDGTRIAFTGCDEGPNEVYVMPAAGGPATRLTYLGGETQVVGWRDDHTIIFRSNAGQPMPHWMTLFAVSPSGGEPSPLGVGVAHSIAYGPGGAVVLGRHIVEDSYHWKGYRGGLGGQLWVDASGTGTFTRILTVLDGHITSPCWVGDRIYFLSDHEGPPRAATANVYSCLPDGGALHRHTHHTHYYARNLSTDGRRLVFQSGGDLYLLERGAFSSTKLEIDLPGPRQQRARKFFSASRFLEETSDHGRQERTADLHPRATHIALTARGKALALHADGGGAVIQLGDPDATRYRLLTWLPDRKRLVTVADPSGIAYAEPCLAILTADGSAPPCLLPGLDIGRVIDLVPAPRGARIALTNHRFEIVLVDLDDLDHVKCGVLDTNAFGPIQGIAWSPDSETLAYGYPLDTQRTAIKLRRVNTPADRLAADPPESCLATDPVLADTDPSFDPSGRYLYFLGTRDFNQALDSAGRERPYAVPLRRDIGSPFVAMPRPLKGTATNRRAEGASEADDADEHSLGGADAADPDACPQVLVHAGNITERAIAFPVRPGRYGSIVGIPGGVVYSRDTILYAYHLNRRQEVTLTDPGVADFTVTTNGAILIRSEDGLFTTSLAAWLADPGADISPPRAIDLSAIEVSVRPDYEWRQMYFDAWRMQRDYFWDKNMNRAAWVAVRDRYALLLDRIASRGDLTDLIWEMQGELRASHAYANGGEYRRRRYYSQGFLGVDWDPTYDRDAHGYRIACFAHGDLWNAGATDRGSKPGSAYGASSPLLAPGLDVRKRDAVVAIDGQRLTAEVGPQQLLVNKARHDVELIVRSAGDAKLRRVTVRALTADEERGARYRDWVNGNRQHVSAKTHCRVGYIHVPDMDSRDTGNGYAEFLRAYQAEWDREGLIVDMRWNGGGHISPFILDVLTRKRSGWQYRQQGTTLPYPEPSPRGPMVALINEMTSSDAETFSHLFRALNLGPLVGTRTWGGNIYISTERALTDGARPSQPQYLHCYIDVGCDIENHGVDPVRDPVRDRANQVDIAPQDYQRGVDPQLDRAIAEALHQIAVRTMRTPLPDVSVPNEDDRRAS